MDATAILGICLSVLGLIFAYIWRANGKMQKEILATVKEIAQGQKEIAQGQREIAKMVTEGFSRLEEGQKEIVQGQREIARMITEGLKYLADLIVQTSKK